MEIPDYPYDDRFHTEIKQIDIKDPEIEKFFFDLGSENRQARKNLMIEQRYRELLIKLGEYTEEQILEYAAVFLNFGTDSQLYAGTLMKKWKEQQSAAGETTREMRKEVLETVKETV